MRGGLAGLIRLRQFSAFIPEFCVSYSCPFLSAFHFPPSSFSFPSFRPPPESSSTHQSQDDDGEKNLPVTTPGLDLRPELLPHRQKIRKGFHPSILKHIPCPPIQAQNRSSIFKKSDPNLIRIGLSCFRCLVSLQSTLASVLISRQVAAQKSHARAQTILPNARPEDDGRLDGLLCLLPAATADKGVYERARRTPARDHYAVGTISALSYRETT